MAPAPLDPQCPTAAAPRSVAASTDEQSATNVDCGQTCMANYVPRDLISTFLVSVGAGKPAVLVIDTVLSRIFFRCFRRLCGNFSAACNCDHCADQKQHCGCNGENFKANGAEFTTTVVDGENRKVYAKPERLCWLVEVLRSTSSCSAPVRYSTKVLQEQKNE